MTSPLTPPDCDLQDFPFMPLHVARLRDSDLASEVDPEACWYAVLLWAASWHQLPAASLPDSEAVLTKLVGLGRDLRTFRKHKAGALRGFVLCNDGRLYHPVVAEQALNAWRGKLEQRWRTECARVKKANQRNKTDLPLPTFEEFHAALPEGSRLPGVASYVPRDTGARPQGHDEDRPEGHNDASLGTGGSCPQDSGVQEIETGTPKGTGSLEAVVAVARAPAIGDQPDDWPPGGPSDHMALLAEIVASPRLAPGKQPGLVTTLGRLAAWRRDGASWGFDVLPVVAGIAQKRGPPIANWKYFDAAVAQSIADNRKALTIPEASHERLDHHKRSNTTREDRRGVWAEVLAEERREGVG